MPSIPTEHQYKAKWRWPSDLEASVRSFTDDRYTLNICAGKSPIGDIRFDADPENNPDVMGDHKRLPFDDETFEAVVWDPPWKMAYFDRFKPFYEAVRVCETGGHIIVNAKWLCESNCTQIVNPFDAEGDDEVLIIRADNPWRDASIVTVHEKLSEQASLEAWMDAETDAVPTRPRENRWGECYTCGDERPLEDLPFESDHHHDAEFCSAKCLHEFEDWLGEGLTPVDPEKHDLPHVHPQVVAEWMNSETDSERAAAERPKP